MLGSNTEPPRVAFAVGRTVGDAVTRNRVRRQLRAALQEHATDLAAGAGYLVRATPGAAPSSYTELSASLRAILGELSTGKP